jgi:aspartate dehydrogenase
MRFRPLRLGLLGCGNIACIISRHKISAEIVAVFDKDPKRSERFAEETGARAYRDFLEFLADDFDILLEAASVQAVCQYAELSINSGKELIILSVGALAEPTFRKHLTETAISQGTKIRIPSGALFGLDNLKVARISRIDSVILRTIKNPRSFRGLPIEEKTLLFHGTAKDCIKHYPRNVNVAVALSLAADKEIEVELWVDPACHRNSHQVLIRGEFGEADILVRNVPSPDNPATSYLAALSVLTLLEDLSSPLIVGT